jgi:hypothetical protein
MAKVRLSLRVKVSCIPSILRDDIISGGLWGTVAIISARLADYTLRRELHAHGKHEPECIPVVFLNRVNHISHLPSPIFHLVLVHNLVIVKVVLMPYSGSNTPTRPCQSLCQMLMVSGGRA